MIDPRSVKIGGASMSLAMSEKQLQEAIVDAARTLGWLVYHTYDSRKSTAGFPDLVLARQSRLIFAELKDAKGKLTPAQAMWLRVLGTAAEDYSNERPLERSPVEVHVWRPAEWLDGTIEEVLR